VTFAQNRVIVSTGGGPHTTAAATTVGGVRVSIPGSTGSPSDTDTGERRTLSAHRFALLLAAGALDHQTFGEHHCNETLCVRVDPTHLHPGTQSANLRYAVSLGRHRGCLPTDIDPRGRHGRAHAIRAALTGGYDPLRLAAARTYSLTPTLPLFDLSTR